MDFVFDPSLVLYLPLWKLDGASIMSQDAYGHTCTVNGALWTPQGRTFDGTDDLITVGRIRALEGADATYTISLWTKMTDNLTEVRALFAYDANNVLAPTDDIYCYWSVANDALQVAVGNTPFVSNVTDLGDLGWHHLVFARTSTNTLVYEDGAGVDDEVKTNPNGSSSHVFKLGDDYQVEYWKGTIGEVRIYNRTLTAQEILHNYQATKWRYR